MPACDSSIRVLCVQVDPSTKGLDLNDHVGQDARAVLDLLVERDCPMSVELAGDDEVGGGVEAVYEAGTFRFYNLIANTSEAAEKFGVRVPEIVISIDRGLLTGVRIESGRWLVAKDAKWDAFSKERLESVKPSRKVVEKKGVGLKRQVTEIVKNGHLPVEGFTIHDLRNVLSAFGWEAGTNYGESSIPSVLNRLEDEKLIQLDKIGRMDSRIWSVRGKRVAEVLIPPPRTVGGQIDAMVEELAGVVVSRVKGRAKEILGL